MTIINTKGEKRIHQLKIDFHVTEEIKGYVKEKGGFAEHFDIAPTLVRLGWVVFCVIGGTGLLVYIIAAIHWAGKGGG